MDGLAAKDDLDAINDLLAVIPTRMAAMESKSK